MQKHSASTLFPISLNPTALTLVLTLISLHPTALARMMSLTSRGRPNASMGGASMLSMYEEYRNLAIRGRGSVRVRVRASAWQLCLSSKLGSDD